MTKHLLTLYTRTPLHVGCGTSVDVVDLPIMRERITKFPVIPGSSLKGVLLQAARELFENGTHARKDGLPAEAKLLFGAIEKEGDTHNSNAGCVQIMEAKLLAFPVRSLAGCFAWITCPAVLERYKRDTGADFEVPQPHKDQVIAGSDLIAGNHVVLEEYALAIEPGKSISAVAAALKDSTQDPLWTANLEKRLAIVHDENFQHFVTTCTEVVTRIAINPVTRTVKGSDGSGGGALFNQENVPCEALFYSLLSVLAPRRPGSEGDANTLLTHLLKSNPTLQIGGDETTGHGLCETQLKTLA
jgi:CRISPR-associated protein Cmr4